MAISAEVKTLWGLAIAGSAILALVEVRPNYIHREAPVISVPHTDSQIQSSGTNPSNEPIAQPAPPVLQIQPATPPNNPPSTSPSTVQQDSEKSQENDPSTVNPSAAVNGSSTSATPTQAAQPSAPGSAPDGQTDKPATNQPVDANPAPLPSVTGPTEQSAGPNTNATNGTASAPPQAH